jgi:hypothetical protein
VVLALDHHRFPVCLAHGDWTMWMLSLTEPEGRAGYLSWRADMESRGATLPEVKPA